MQTRMEFRVSAVEGLIKSHDTTLKELRSQLSSLIASVETLVKSQNLLLLEWRDGFQSLMASNPQKQSMRGEGEPPATIHRTSFSASGDRPAHPSSDSTGHERAAIGSQETRQHASGLQGSGQHRQGDHWSSTATDRAWEGLPSFHGNDPFAWVAKSESYFVIPGIPLELRLPMVQLCKDGLTLYGSMTLRELDPRMTWERFKRSLFDRYGRKVERELVGVGLLRPEEGRRRFDRYRRKEEGDPIEKLKSISQLGSVDEYADVFERVTSQISHLPEEWYMSCFLGGLHEEVKSRVRTHETPTRVRLISISSSGARSSGAFSSFPATTSQISETMPSKSIRVRHVSIQSGKAHLSYQGSLSPRPCSFKDGLPKGLSSLRNASREKLGRQVDSTATVVDTLLVAVPQIIDASSSFQSELPEVNRSSPHTVVGAHKAHQLRRALHHLPNFVSHPLSHPCLQIVHFPVIDVCSSSQGFLVSAGQSISSNIPPLKPMIPESDSVVGKGAREILQLLLNGSSPASPPLIDVLPSALHHNDDHLLLVTRSGGMYSGSRDVEAIANATVSLVMWAKPLIESGNARSILDPDLEGNIDEVQMHRVVLTATFCFSRSASRRPTMIEILNLLKRAIPFHPP